MHVLCTPYGVGRDENDDVGRIDPAIPNGPLALINSRYISVALSYYVYEIRLLMHN